MAAQEEVRARHILVENEDEAKAIARADQGRRRFRDAWPRRSPRTRARADGGDLGYFTKDQMVPEFADVAFKMYPGQVSNPVKSQFGWHIIKVEDKRTKRPPEFEKVKDQIETFLARKAQTEFVAKLRQNAKIERLDKPADRRRTDARANSSRYVVTDIGSASGRPEHKPCAGHPRLLCREQASDARDLKCVCARLPTRYARA